MTSTKFSFVEPNRRLMLAARKDPNASAANLGTVIIDFPALSDLGSFRSPVSKPSVNQPAPPVAPEPREEWGRLIHYK